MPKTHKPPHSSYFTIKTLPASTWVVFGSLTYKYPVRQTEQLTHFTTLMEALGRENKAHAHRLHWVLRHQFGGDDAKNRGHLHLHFVLGGHKVTNGFHRPFSPTMIAKFLDAHWRFGNTRIEPYDPKRYGIEYLLREDEQEMDTQDPVVISKALRTILTSSSPVRDKSMVEALVELRDRGTDAWFGDEVPHWSKS